MFILKYDINNIYYVYYNKCSMDIKEINIKNYDYEFDDIAVDHCDDNGENYLDVLYNVHLESEKIHDGIYTLWDQVICPYIHNIYVSDILMNLNDYSKFYHFFIKKNDLCTKITSILNSPYLNE